MKVTLNTPPAQKIVCLNDFKDGEIGVIDKWIHPQYEGLVVQRYDTGLVIFGKETRSCFPFIYQDKNFHLLNDINKAAIRLLNSGESITITPD